MSESGTRNCWQLYKQITNSNDLSYFRVNNRFTDYQGAAQVT